jgi:hypothetical protein
MVGQDAVDDFANANVIAMHFRQLFSSLCVATERGRDRFTTPTPGSIMHQHVLVRELGQVERTLFLLRYISKTEARPRTPRLMESPPRHARACRAHHIGP